MTEFAHEHGRRCFLISAFGREKDESGSQNRVAWERAIAVRDGLLQRAVDLINPVLADRRQAPIYIFRGDHSRETGSIVSGITRSLCRDPVLIAVMLLPNENVAYEVGVADGLGRPVILLRHESCPEYFDLRHRMMVLFDDEALVPGPAQNRKAQEIAEFVLQHLPADGSRDFAPSLVHPDAASPSRCIPFDRFRITYEEWAELFWSARREIWVAGTTLHQLVVRAKFRKPKFGPNGLQLAIDGEWQWAEARLLDALLAQWRAGCDVTVLIYDEHNPALEPILQRPDGDMRYDLRAVRHELEETTETVTTAMRRMERESTEWKSASTDARESGGTFRFVKVRHGLLTHRVSMTERGAYITPIFLTCQVNTGPCFETAPKAAREQVDDTDRTFSRISLYEMIRDDLLFLRSINPSFVLDPEGIIADGFSDRPGNAIAAE